MPPRESEARWLFSLGSLVLSRCELTGSRLPRSSFFYFSLPSFDVDNHALHDPKVG